MMEQQMQVSQGNSEIYKTQYSSHEATLAKAVRELNEENKRLISEIENLKSNIGISRSEARNPLSQESFIQSTILYQNSSNPVNKSSDIK